MYPAELISFLIQLAAYVAAAGVGALATWWRCTWRDREQRRARDRRLREVENLYLRGLATDHRNTSVRL